MYRQTVYRETVYRQTVYRQTVYRETVYRQTVYRETVYRQTVYRQTDSITFCAKKAWNTAIQNHYALDVNKLKQLPVNTPALSESIICAV